MANQRIEKDYRWSLPHRRPWATRDNGVSIIGVILVMLAVVLAYWFIIGY